MTTPSGQISLNDVNVELGLAGTTLITMNDAAVRTLAGVGGSGTVITMQNLQGKSNRVALSYTFSAPATATTINISALGGYSSGKTDATITVSSNVYVYSTSTGSYGLTLSGATTGDTVTLVNNGFIMGQGGAGGNAYPGPSRVGGTGGSALDVNIGVPGITVTNTSGYIGGGGGGGGSRDSAGGGGGGAGGATGGNSGPNSGGPSAAGGSGGGIGASGGNGGYSAGGPAKEPFRRQGGGGGGRILPGTGGAGAVGGEDSGGKGGGSGGGGGSNSLSPEPTFGDGGPGGSAGSAGTSKFISGGGGGWGATGGGTNTNPGGAAGGSGGKAVNLNGKSLTWTGGPAGSSRAYGAVS